MDDASALSFNRLKALLTTALAQQLSDPEEPFIIESRCFCLGCCVVVLSQKASPEKNLHPSALFSHHV